MCVCVSILLSISTYSCLSTFLFREIQRCIYFKEVAHAIVEVGKLEI